MEISTPVMKYPFEVMEICRAVRTRSETVRKPFGKRSESVRNPFGIRSNPFGPVRDMLGTRRELFYPCGCCFARSGVGLTRIIAISLVELFLERFVGRRYG